MKQLTSQNLIVEMSVRELEMVKNALLHYSCYWDQRAENTLRVAEGAQIPFKQIAEDYEDLWKNVANLLESIPF